MKIETDIEELAGTAADKAQRQMARRDAWRRLMMRWHWVSAALALVGMLFFATTGITLTNAGYFENTKPVVTHYDATLPMAVLADINRQAESPSKALPASLNAWVRSTWGLTLYPKNIEWQAEELFVDLKRPGVDAWLSINRQSGAVQYEASDQGWIAFFDDLHRGKNTGPIWSWLVTAFGACCIVFSLTGLVILQIHAKSRWKVWPVVGFGLLVPTVLVLVFVH